MTMQLQHNSGDPKKTGSSHKRTSCGKESEQIVLLEIAMEMKDQNLPETFIINAIRAAFDYDGIADLMKLWKVENDQVERDGIIADIQDMLDACLQKGKAEEFYVKFNDLDTIAKNIRMFKDSLLLLVEQNGGLKYLSHLTEIPQPSLSRFFNSNSMPQRSTLIKIAKALDIDELRMDSFWRNNDQKEDRTK